MQKEKYKVYVVGEGQNDANSNGVKEKLQEFNIELLPPIDSFSITSPLKTWASTSKLRSYISQYKIDLVHILFATPHALWANYIKVPYIITTRGSDALVVLPSLLESGGIRGMYDKWLFSRFKKAFANAKINTATSIAQMGKLMELFHINNIEIIRTGVDVERIANAKDQTLLDPSLAGQKFIFSPRFMAPVYNIGVQIDAIALLPKEVLVNYIFVFIRGKQYNVDYYERMKSKLEGLKASLHFTYLIKDYLNQEDLWTYYNYASLTVMTPRSDGTPNSALEAMVAKCPLIMPDLPYDKAIFENTCFVWTGNEAKELAGLMEKALVSYPVQLLDTAYHRANEQGNRAIEMNKLEKLYS
ncbi:MAG: glycosyltransferase 1 protein [Bacteroidetes bacterium]|nr:glycosyltransferase 1 protein [Bacteroidota bacterium]